MEEKSKAAGRRSIVEWTEALIFSFVVIVLLYTFAFRIITINGSSMENTLNGGDRILIQCIAGQVDRGDVIVADSYTKYGAPLVKRVIATEGDEVDIDFTTGEVFVNGEKQAEPYISAPTTRQGDVPFPLTVGKNKLFVLGDHRDVSLDSRFSDVGLIDERDVLGKARLRIFPFDKIGVIR